MITNNFKTFLISILLVAITSLAFANPSETGVTGLVKIPTADTLDSGNICVGVWGNMGKSGEQNFAIAPTTITMGIGSFWEMYGSYPNILFNGQEDRSGRGFVGIGSKLRFWGKRNQPFKVAADVFLQKNVSEDQTLDGINDVGGRLIASLKLDTIAFHLNGGYLSKGLGGSDYIYGAGVEYLPTSKTKVTFELSGQGSVPVEALVGLQYYISPHLTINLAGGTGITSGSPDWRAIVGISTCQGIGNYINVIPTIASEEKAKKVEVIKQVKVTPITSLIKTALPTAAVSKLEVPVDPDKEEIVIKPFGQIVIPPQPVAPPVVLPPTPREPAAQPKEPVKDQHSQQQKEPTIAEPRITKLESEVPVDVKKQKAAALNPVAESNADGVSPLYGIEVRGDNVEISTAKAAQSSAKMVVYRKFRFPDIIFQSGQADLSEEIKKSLSEVAEQARNDKNWNYMRIDGHTDNVGSVSYNTDLSMKRAIAIANFLILKEGIDPSRVFVKGLGKSKPLVDNATSDGKKTNRRFEILFLVPKK